MNTTQQALQKRNALLEETLVAVSNAGVHAVFLACAFSFDIGQRGIDSALVQWAQLPA